MSEGRPLKVHVTGAYGLIGNLTYRHLSGKDDYEVYGSGRRTVSSDRIDDEDLLRIPDDRFSLADLTDRDAVSRALSGMDAVVHLGAVPDPGASFETILESNIRGTYNVLEVCREEGIRRLDLREFGHGELGVRTVLRTLQVAPERPPRRAARSHAHRQGHRPAPSHGTLFGQQGLGRGHLPHLPRRPRLLRRLPAHRLGQQGQRGHRALPEIGLVQPGGHYADHRTGPQGHGKPGVRGLLCRDRRAAPLGGPGAYPGPARSRYHRLIAVAARRARAGCVSGACRVRAGC